MPFTGLTRAEQESYYLPRSRVRSYIASTPAMIPKTDLESFDSLGARETVGPRRARRPFLQIDDGTNPWMTFEFKYRSRGKVSLFLSCLSRP